VSNPHSIYVRTPKPYAQRLECSHCEHGMAWYKPEAEIYVAHVKKCLAKAIANWDPAAYSKTYFEQVRAMSRFKAPGDPRRRNRFRSWAWWSVARPDGPPLVAAEIAHA
jgi:hypothetical protein